MKKLMIMLGAVAMSFGLFAALTDPEYAISFESAEGTKGVNVSAMTFTPDETDWVWGGAALPLKAYVSEKLPYTDDGALARRDGAFDGLDSNANYLSLETGSAELTRAVKGNTYLDQLVKFTGFEAAPTLDDGTKIAVWMSEFPVDGDEDATTTNLYVTVGKFAAGAIEQVSLKIDGNYELDKFYRLTIKSLGNIYKETSQYTAAGFAVYINGKQVASSDEDATALTDKVGDLTADAKALMGVGALFTAIDTTAATFTTVGYKGIGAIDDIILDATGPLFCQKINIDFGTLPDGVEVWKVYAGTEELTAPYAVMDNTEVSVYFKAVDGKKLVKGTDKNPVVKTITSSDATIDSSAFEAADVVAKVNGTVELAECELFAAFGGLKTNDKVAILAACNVTNGEAAILYHFTKNTTIGVAADGWDVFVGNVDEVTAGGIIANADIEAGATLAVTFEDGENGAMEFGAAAVAGALEVTNGMVTVLGPETGIAVAGSVKAANFDFSRFGFFVLAKDATVLTKDNTISTDPTMGYIIPGDDADAIEISEEPDEDGYYTYTAVQSAPTTWTIDVPAPVTHTELFVTAGKEELGTTGGVYTISAEISEVSVRYAIADNGYDWADPSAEKTWTVTKGEQVAITAPTVVAIEYTITYFYKTAPLSGLSPETYTVVSGATLPLKADVVLPEGAEFDGWYDNAACEGDAVTAIAIGSIGNTNFYAKAKVIAPADPTTDKPEDIPSEATAATYFPNVSAEIKATGIKARDLAIWCQGNGKGDGSAISAGGANIMLDAYKLDCANTESAVRTARANFKFTAADLAAVMAGGELTTLNSMKINGTLEITTWADPAFTVEYTDGDACFYKAEITVPAKE